MRVLVTGHRGLIGRAVVARLEAAGDTVIGTLALALATGANMREAATLANHAAWQRA